MAGWSPRARNRSADRTGQAQRTSVSQYMSLQDGAAGSAASNPRAITERAPCGRERRQTSRHGNIFIIGSVRARWPSVRTKLVIRTLHRVLTSAFDVHSLRTVPSLDVSLTKASRSRWPTRAAWTYLRSRSSPTTCVIIEDNGKRSLKRVVTAVDAGGACSMCCKCRPNRKAQDELRSLVPEITHLDMAELPSAPSRRSCRSPTRARVQQYQRYSCRCRPGPDPAPQRTDPDALAAGLALRNPLRRTRTTAIIAAMQGVTRPENAHGGSPGHSGRADHAGRVRRFRPDRHRGCPAALFRRPDRPRGSGHRSPS